jgi:hypothetical protein
MNDVEPRIEMTTAGDHARQSHWGEDLARRQREASETAVARAREELERDRAARETFARDAETWWAEIEAEVRTVAARYEAGGGLVRLMIEVLPDVVRIAARLGGEIVGYAALRLVRNEDDPTVNVVTQTRRGREERILGVAVVEGQLTPAPELVRAGLEPWLESIGREK